jgi:solute carrier family 10 (sodium/bile acid cotransporter), member 7
MEDPPLRPSRLKLCKDVGNFLLGQWLLIAIGVVIVLAYYFPDVGKTGGIVKSQYTVTYGAVAVIFLVSGLTLPTERLLLHILNWRLHVIVQVTSFLLVSACFFGVTAAISSAGNSSIQTAALVGLVITGCLPTTISSNVVMTKAAGGDDAATMVEVTIGNLLGPFITPLLISRLYLPAIGAFASLSPASDNATLRPLYARVMKQMGLSVFLPLAVGQLVQFIWPKKTKDICTRFKIAKLGSLGLLCIIW